MWIRSQDKYVLVDTNRITVTDNKVVCYSGTNVDCLGTYRTQERALEVLDDIQAFLVSRTKTIETLNSYSKHVIKNIYDMPAK